ncbi:MAG: HAD family hydrolase [Planctomycetes bacterium]|nr:HAD family hydrolase [Planctomycetota bacterium]
MSRIVFLDRDGTLNAEVGFVARPDQLRVLPGVPDAVARLHGAGYRIVVVTNQSGIARGLYSPADLARVHARLHQALHGLPLAYLHCPHHPEAPPPWGGPCSCRKPAPGLLLQARELLGLSFEGAVLIGDSARDLLMARELPAIRTIYVHSGKPPVDELSALWTAGVRPHAQAVALPEAVAALLEP